MNPQSVFKQLKPPLARGNGWLPIFFDFTIGNLPEDFPHPLVIDEIITQTSDTVDGIIMMPRNILDAESLKGKEIWARSDWTSALSPTIPGKEEIIIPLLNPQYWEQGGISGIVSTLLLGNSSTHEADNIQYLASQRSYSFDIGMPMAIDLHVLGENGNKGTFDEIIELGLTLAVELGCDMVILPGGDYLTVNRNFNLIADLPVLARYSLNKLNNRNWASESWKQLLNKVDGIVLTDTFHWMEIFDNHPHFF